MAMFEKKLYCNVLGNWVLLETKFEKVSCSAKFWQKSCFDEAKRNDGERSFLYFGKNKDCIDKVVTYFRKFKEERKLITKSNVLPKKYQGGNYA